MFKRIFFVLVIVALALPALAIHLPAAAQEDSAPYWPTESWRTSTPEEQGMDSAALASFIENVPKLGNVDGLMIVRNGYVVAEVYWHPFSRELKHELYSASKSVLSALVGIAIDRGYIESVDQKVLGFFPEIEVKDLDDNKQAITIRDLLTMRSGFDCQLTGSLSTNTDPLVDLLVKPNGIQLGLDWPMADAPGRTFRYCQINPYLLSAILTRTTGMDTLAFAQQYLFAPLGITDADWMVSAEGLAHGWAGLWLNTPDMAKIGYLFLNDGRWGDEQVVPALWVNESTQTHVWDIGLPYARYSYLWWTYDAPFGHFYEANGANFQRIIVSEDKDLVVAVTGADDRLNIRDIMMPHIMEAVVSAVKSDEPLPPNPEGTARLEAAVNAAANPQAQPVPPLPPIAAQISGKTYRLMNPDILFSDVDRMRVPDGDWKVAKFGMDFGDDEATLTLELLSDTELNVTVGLDDVYRVTASPLGTLAAKGAWATETTFILYLRFLEPSRSLRYTLTFSERQLVGWAEDVSPDFGEALLNGDSTWIWGER
jgi:CubicO group peptidase (beta-lactamase class C family)